MQFLSLTIGERHIMVSKIGTLDVEKMNGADDVRRALAPGFRDVTVIDPRTMLPAEQNATILVNTALVSSAELVTFSRVERV